MCRPVTSEISMVLCILMAKEFTEWGRLISSVADTAFKRKWTLPELAGEIFCCQSHAMATHPSTLSPSP